MDPAPSNSLNGYIIVNQTNRIGVHKQITLQTHQNRDQYPIKGCSKGITFVSKTLNIDSDRK